MSKPDTKISSEIKKSIINYLANTCNSEFDAEERFGVEADDIIDIILEAGYERCCFCDFWQEKRDLTEDEDGIQYVCEDCK